MGIEDLLGRIADALVEGNEICQKRLDLCEQMLAIRKTEASPHAEESAEDLNREKLLARCTELSITVPKGTKTPTLVKLIAAREAELASASSGESTPAADSAVSDKSEPSVQFESLAELRAACRELLANPKGSATPAESAAAQEVYSRYGRSLGEIPQEKWGEFYAAMKSAFEEAHRNA